MAPGGRSKRSASKSTLSWPQSSQRSLTSCSVHAREDRRTFILTGDGRRSVRAFSCSWRSVTPSCCAIVKSGTPARRRLRNQRSASSVQRIGDRRLAIPTSPFGRQPFRDARPTFGTGKPTPGFTHPLFRGQICVSVVDGGFRHHDVVA